MELEENSPHLRDHTAELWRDFIRRDVPSYSSPTALIPEPKNPHSWSKVYRKLQREALRDAERDAEALEAAMSGLQAAKDARTTTQFVKPMAGLLPGTKRKAAADAKRAKTTTGVLQSGGGKGMKRVTGSAMLGKVRREAGAFKSMTALGGPKKQPAQTVIRAPRKASVVPRSGTHAAALKQGPAAGSGKGKVAEASPQKDSELPVPRTFTAPKPKVKLPPAGDVKAAEKPMMSMKRKPPDNIFMPAKKRK